MQTFITVDDFNQDKPLNYGVLGEIVDVRTYRRWLEAEQRRETAYERWARVINYNLNLVADKLPTDELRKEALLMADKFSSFRADASGRTKWVGGTSATSKHPEANYNCSFLAVNRLDAFSEAFSLLMLGCGVGFRVFSRDINQLPKLVNKNLEIEFQKYSPLPKHKRLENTEYALDKKSYVIVGDSRQGWIDAVMFLLRASVNPIFPHVKIVFNFDSVRPQGERLKGFGGTASGHEALATMIRDIHRIITEIPSDTFRSVDCMDIMCAIAKGVVAGSSRRSAMICLFEQGDKLCSDAKKGLYTNPDLAYKSYRSQSNNTACLTEKPSLDEIRSMLETCKTEGEPGFNNYSEMVRRRKYAAEKWRPDEDPNQYLDVGCNPCHEIILSAGLNGKSGSFCNLVTLPLPNFVKDGKLDYAELEICIRLITRISLRQTCVDIPMPGWDETQKEERLLGVSVTGWQDAFSLLGWETGDYNIDDLLFNMNRWANHEATVYSQKLGVNRPLLVTCIKPEGTASTIFGVSSGLHWDWAPYYIRRVRMSVSDALAKTLMDQGFPFSPEIYDLQRVFPDCDSWQALNEWALLDDFEKRQIINRCSTVVFEFPVKSYTTRTQADVSAIEQLESLKAFTVHYCDHMPSVTISVKDNEWEQVAEWVDQNWNQFITASFFPYYDAAYPLLPYEAITEERYQQLVEQIPDCSKALTESGRIRFVVDELLLSKNEWSNTDDTDVNAVDCSSGTCPIR